MNKINTKALLSFTEDEKQMLEAEASKMKLPLSVYLRLVVLGIIHRGDSPPKDVSK
jgi:hypothetical protein